MLAALHHAVDKGLTLAGTGFESEGSSQAADHVVEPYPGFDQVVARRDDAAHTMGGGRLDVHLFIEAGTGKLSQPGCVMRISLVRLQCLQALMCLPMHAIGIPRAPADEAVVERLCGP